MDVFKNIIKKSKAEEEVLSFEPRRLELDLTESAKVYLNEENRKKSDFVISHLLAQQTGVAEVESQAHKDKVEREVLERLKEVQERAYEEAFSLGKEEGSKQAFESVRGEWMAKIERFSRFVTGLESLREEILKSQEQELIRLVFHIGKKIALKDLAEDSSVVKELLEKILSEYEKSEEIKIHLSEEDQSFISEEIASGRFQFPDSSKLKLFADKEITNGGCRVQTEYGSIDSQVEQRIENLWNSLKARMPQGGGEGAP
jgi:flagellar assembly protein FliH